MPNTLSFPKPLGVEDATIRRYWEHLPKWRIAEIFRRNGKTFVAVERAHPSPSEPPDLTIYRVQTVERNLRGADVEVLDMTEVAWLDGATGVTRYEDPDAKEERPLSVSVPNYVARCTRCHQMTTTNDSVAFKRAEDCPSEVMHGACFTEHVKGTFNALTRGARLA